jgi:hypothetical protein
MKLPLVLALLLSCGCGQAASETAASPSDSPPASSEGKRAPCTLGADQTCNEDPSVSALWGRCTELGVCECQAGFALSPRGRCQPN